MMEVVFSILAFIVAIGVLVAVHEFGHFWVARRLGFKVVRFSVGFGKPLARWRGAAPDHTEYWLSTIPLGGYVKLLDEREAPVDPEERHRAFNRRPIPHRVAVLVAGPGFNFLFAIVAYWMMFVAGVPGMKPLIGAVEPGSAAAMAGLEAQDEIISVGGRETQTWENAILAILDELLDGGQIDLTVVDPTGARREVQLDVRGREAELTEPQALFSGLGIEPGPVRPPILGELTEDGAAAQAGLEPGDRIISLDGQQVRSFSQLVDLVRERPGEQVTVRIARGGSELTLPMRIGQVMENGALVGRIGAAENAEALREAAQNAWSEQSYGLVAALGHGVSKTWEMSALTVRMLARMVVGDVSIRNISGPINIAAYAGDSARAGLSTFLSFLAIVSISLGILNLLPVPLLDGGQIVYQVAEGIKGAPLSERAMALGQQVGIVLLIVLMSFAFYNDLSRMFG